ncbi:MAG: SDR family NAD(P)-dependent oxidoreductase [Lachnospiraceae bacterium]|nr:SDR family NAD(P)-dependent oxidoreductase [Lachnospiraceae bacterium]
MRKKALITGASRGIGAAIADMLAKEGYDLVITCKNSKESLERQAGQLRGDYGVCCEAILCDASDPEQVDAMLGQIGNVDVLVNNAAVSYVGLLTDMSVEKWREVLDTNLSSLFYTCRGVLPGMVRRKKGKIVNISSVWGAVGASMEVAYSASKGGVNSFTRALAKELAPSNIQVNAAAFGVIDTQMNRCFSQEERAALVEEIPADRMGTAAEAARLVGQILHMPDYFTGQVVTMDGGWI